MKTTKFIQRLRAWNGDARLYELSEPLRINSSTTTFIVVFAAENKERKKVVRVFASNEDGTVRNWTVLVELQNEQVHEKALSSLGFELVPVLQKTTDGKIRSSFLVEEIFDYVNKCSIHGLVDLHNQIFDRHIRIEQIVTDGNEGSRL